MTDSRLPRRNPCPSCPYRRDVPSGIWSEEEYAKLPGWDGDAAYQDHHSFSCHQDAVSLCSGWVAHRGDPRELLAIRLGVAHQSIDPSVVDYITTVPLFPSGAEAAEHGRRDIAAPSQKAIEMVHKICRLRGIPLALVGLLSLAVLLGCGSAPKVWACASVSEPPMVTDDRNCPQPVGTEGGQLFRWYSAPESDIGPDDQPVIGQELDGDFWNFADRYDLDEAKKTTAKKAPPTTKKTTTKARPSTRSS